MNYKVISHISPIYYGPLLRMIHRAFASHLDNGLRFTCSFYTIDDLNIKYYLGIVLWHFLKTILFWEFLPSHVSAVVAEVTKILRVYRQR